MPKHRRRRSPLAAIGGALLIAAAALAIAGNRPAAVRVTAAGDVPGAATASSAAGVPAPRASAPGDHRITVHPERIVIPTLGVDAAIRPILVGPGRVLDPPSDPAQVGWWRGGAQPGSPRGTAVIAGHIDSARDGPGALVRIGELSPGERVTVSGEGGSVTYQVTGRRTYRKDALPPATFAQDTRARLVLITCGGLFDRSTGHYADNTVVFAVPRQVESPGGRLKPLDSPSP